MRLTIRDLERESGLSRRTIHFYAQEGLLPAPAGAGPSSTYGEEHLLRLRLIPTLKTAGLRLDRIGCALDGLSLAEMRWLVHLAPEADLDDPVRLAEWLQRGRDQAADGDGASPGERRSPAADGDTPSAEPTIADRAWIRRRLAPGVELRYRPTSAADLDAKVERLTEVARELFGESRR